MGVTVFRLGHRFVRDDRITTHVFLVARAFGAGGVIYSGQRDEKLEEKVDDVTEAWGGPFQVEYEKNWQRSMEKWREAGGEIVHLTIYGLPIQDTIQEIRDSPKDKLIVVGGAKVPGVVYRMSNWNVAVTSQPHSEVSALGIFLHELFEGRELTKNFEGAKLGVVPQREGKRVIKL